MFLYFAIKFEINIMTRGFARIYVYVADMSIINIATYNVIYNCFDIVAICMKLYLIELILRHEERITVILIYAPTVI